MNSPLASKQLRFDLRLSPNDFQVDGIPLHTMTCTNMLFSFLNVIVQISLTVSTKPLGFVLF